MFICMSYGSHFALADNYIYHTNKVIDGIADPLIQRQYIGFIAISAVTVYELAIKDIFINFSNSKHKILGAVVTDLYKRINGRITINELRDKHIPRFGEKYKARFIKRLDEIESAILNTHNRSIKASYANIIVWRNNFVHNGHIPSNASLNEINQAYPDGKIIINVLARTMTR